jgi:hypothetical protein
MTAAVMIGIGCNLAIQMLSIRKDYIANKLQKIIYFFPKNNINIDFDDVNVNKINLG